MAYGLLVEAILEPSRAERHARVIDSIIVATISIITTAPFAVGGARISHVRQVTANFKAALFGNVLG